MEIKTTKGIVDESAYIDTCYEDRDREIGCNNEDKEWVSVAELRQFLDEQMAVEGIKGQTLDRPIIYVDDILDELPHTGNESINK